MILVVMFWIGCGLIAGAIGTNRGGNAVLWFFLGFAFGPLAIIFALFEGETCSRCKGRVHPDAEVCPHCGAKQFYEDAGAKN